MKYEAILFDMNGVLINDEHLHREAFRQALSDKGIELSDEQYKEFFAGRTDEEGLSDFLNSVSFQGEFTNLLKTKAAIYQELVNSGIQSFEGVEDFIKSAVLKGLKLAVVTSSTRQEAQASLEATGLLDNFSNLVTAEDISTGKPNPEAYLTAAKELGVQPEDCLVIEDAPSGVAAAKKAGMYCIAVTNTHTESELTQADSVVPRLDSHLIQD